MDLTRSDIHNHDGEEADIATYLEHLNAVAASGDYTQPEGSINLPADEELRRSISEEEAAFSNDELAYVLVVGIGGSNLGTKAVYDALVGYYRQYGCEHTPELIFVDTSSPAMLNEVQEFIKSKITTPEQIVVNIISKSGTTTETIVNAELLFSSLTEALGDRAKERIVVTTDEESALFKQATENNIKALTIPALVGGRYSVLSAVGLFPLSLAGVNIDELCQGALDVRERCLVAEFDENPAWQSAAAIKSAIENGLSIHDTFFFHPELETLGKWYRQLTGESLGKEEDREGNVVHAGITPTVSIGSTDLHSVGQLYLGGPNDKLTTFVRAGRADDTVPVPTDGIFSSLVDVAPGHTAGEIMDAIYEGVKQAYRKRERQFMELTLEDVSEYTLGEFLQFKMIEIMYTAHLLGINAFDQPHVELYKTETKRILGGE